MTGWNSAPDVHLAAVVDHVPDVATRFAERWSVPRSMTSFEAVAEDPDIDAVDICLPPALHAPAVRACIAHGKHVLVEKPLSARLDEARELVAEVRAAGVIGMVAENWLFATATRHVARLVDEGALGDLFMVKAIHESDLFADLEAHAAKHPWGLHDESGGFLLRAGIHSIGLAREWLGEYESLVAYATDQRGYERPVPDTDIVVAAKFRRGGVGSMFLTARSRHVGPRRMQMTLYGTAGTVWFDLLSGDVLHTTAEREVATRTADASLGYREEIHHFIHCIRTGSEPRTGLEEQLGGLAATLAARRSLLEGGPVAPGDL
jgi:myo-inositol 2-dehydrogenase / D-chiro-inositol 1-dehydrogenase